MGAEIRRVPPNWRHPKNRNGYVPMFGTPFSEAVKQWERKGKKIGEPKPIDGGTKPYSRGAHVSFTKAEATCYQVYENTTEGTPISPIFGTLKEVVQWCVNQGYSQEDSEAFAKLKWAPSLTRLKDGSYVKGIHGASTVLKRKRLEAVVSCRVFSL